MVFSPTAIFMITTLSNISVHQLKRAVVLREQIEKLEHELTGILGGSHAPATVSVNGAGGRRKMSAAARAKIGAAQRARWAKHKKAAPSAVVVKKGKRKMSPAA